MKKYTTIRTWDSHHPDSFSQMDALIIVDMQEWILTLPLAPYSGQELAQRVSSLIKQWREINPNKPIIWVAYLRQDGSDGGLEGKARISISSRKEEDFLIIKYGISAFQGTKLNNLLQKHGIRRVMVVGIATDYAVSATAIDALKQGYQVWVPADTCSTTSEISQAHTLQELSNLHINTEPFVIGS